MLGNNNNFWRLTTSVYSWKDIDDSFVASHLWTGSEFCSRMKSFSPSNKPTIIRTTGAAAPSLPARLLSSSTVKIQSPWWFGQEFEPPVRPIWFSSRILSSTKTFTEVTSWTPRGFLGPVATLADCNGHFNKIPLQPNERKRRKSDVRPIFPTSWNLRNSRHTQRITTLWITAFG